MSTGKPKRLTPQQITGPLGVNFVEGILLRMGFPWHPTRQEMEGGVDGFVEIRDPATGNLTNSILKLQIKTTSRKWSHESSGEFSFRCEPRDIDYWMGGDQVPVILVAVRPDGAEAYWTNIREVFSNSDRRRDCWVLFDKKTQRFDTSAAKALVTLAVAKNDGFHFPAVAREEDLISNLLEIRSFPPHIYIASTDYREPQEIMAWAKSHEMDLPSGWLLTERSIRSVYELRERPWVELVDRGSVECFDTGEWAESDDADKQREFVRLMNQVLREDMRLRGLRRSKEEDAFFFPARHTIDGAPLERQYNYRSHRKDASRVVATIHRHPKTKEISYCRHHAMRCSFEQIAGQWFLAVTPHYVYTIDGKQPYPHAAELLSGMKKQERQNAVLNQTLMWQRKLTEKRDGLFLQSRSREPLISFGELLAFQCDRGVPDSGWLPGDVDSAGGGLFE